MRKLFLLFSLIIQVSTIYAQDKVLTEHKQKGKLPPGTVWLRDSICIDQTEIRNLDYLEFVKWTQKKDPQQAMKIFPDTSVWTATSELVMPDYYFQHPALKEYPVVGISYEQAVAFCKWRTERVKEFIALSKQSIQERMGVRDFYYRLPTKEEWEYAATAGSQTPTRYGQPVINKKNVPTVFVAETKALYDGNKEIMETVPVKYQCPNRFNLYNMIGNVAEMVQEEGIAKGGSFHHTLGQSAITNDIIYRKPMEWLGFRCVCVFVK